MNSWRNMLPRLHSKGRTFVVLGITGALAFLLVLGESAVRGYFSWKIASAAEGRIHVDPEVSLGSTPAILQMAGRKFSDVRLEAEQADIGGKVKVDFVAHLSNLAKNSSGASVESSRVRAEVTEEALAASRSAEGDGSVEADPETGTLVAHVGPGGQIEVPLTPSLDGDKILLTAGDPTFSGNPVPSGLADMIKEKAEQTVDMSDLPLGLKVDELTVTSGGLRLDLSGGPANLEG
ncbi:DUF2993 domain-containing protein [Streptomyces sp. NPDC015492]|uniref:LmeA family phospholipid-binding protein n=1 Tax=Streptomyces sp. NPDC015492 TaxID=3364958 RepID=UPI0036F63036